MTWGGLSTTDSIELMKEATVAITEQEVEAAAKAVSLDWENHVPGMRLALAAAAKVAPRPVIDREAVNAAVRKHVFSDFGTYVGTADKITDAVVELARPMPTREQIAKALHDDTEVHAWLSESCIDHGCGQTYDRSAAVVLTLLNGSES